MNDRELEIHNLTKALALALTRVIRARERRDRRAARAGIVPSLEIFDAAELMAMPLRSRGFCDAEALANPQQHDERLALMAVRWIGERLHKLGGEGLMLKAIEKATARRRRGNYMSSIADHRWDGVGRTTEHAGWCC
jgi:hypothetical protein